MKGLTPRRKFRFQCSCLNGRIVTFASVGSDPFWGACHSVDPHPSASRACGVADLWND